MGRHVHAVTAQAAAPRHPSGPRSCSVVGAVGWQSRLAASKTVSFSFTRLILTVRGPLSLFKCQARSVSAVTPPRPLLRSAPRGRVAPPAVRPSLQSPQRAAQLTLRSRSLSAWTEVPGSATPAPHSLDGEKPGPGRPSLLRWGPGRCGRKGRGAPPPSSLPRSVLAVAPRGSSAPGRPLPRIPGSSSRCAPLVFIQKKNVISVFQSCFA